jgi:hypothetical protein
VLCIQLQFYFERCKSGAGGTAQAVECLPSKFKDLNSNPSTENKRKKKKKGHSKEAKFGRIANIHTLCHHPTELRDEH